ncbi:MAG: glycosyltransferase family 2 protein [Methanocorpusculum sp.]|uniref:Glycosyltransferase family 2 protein n=2 Tax=Methanocorpusculum vombati TaxID=3002864 RepID=A0ABT4IJS5_9EURY|nr:glycosyltransferase family 2 protein [Methanocorpusculum vombati]MDE2545907.1 glycosyltransferase family 2 protein [Methanocorpusculum sp.]MDE2547445.1 glycosyltransferase family 2 protein [Methanocorpusculum sp.]
MKRGIPMQISVIVPLKNKAQEINRCIDSILAQTITNFELIIVDGNSTDGSLEIVETYQDQRIQIINQQSKGAAAGRNEGIRAAQGELIAFLDADDEYLPEFLDIILHLVERFPTAGMYGTRGYSVANGVIIDPQTEDNIENPDNLILDYFEAVSHGELYSMSGVVIRKSVFDEIGMFNESLIWYEDVEMFGRIGYSYPVARSLRYGFVYHRTASNKITDSIPILPEEHPLITFLQQQHPEEISQRRDAQYIPPYIESLHLKFAGSQILSNNITGARNSLSYVKNPHFRGKKYFLYVCSIMPAPLLRYLRSRTGLRYKMYDTYKKTHTRRRN